MNNPIAEENSSLFNRNFLLILFVNFCSSISFQILTPTLPIYVEQQLGFTEIMVGMVVGILTFTTILVRPFSGKAIDIWNRRNICFIGLLICVFSIFLYQFADQIGYLIFLRLVHGIGWGIVTTATITIATIAIPNNRLGVGMGYYGLSTVFSIAIAPALGLHIINVWDFKVLFLFASSLLLLGTLMSIMIKLPSDDKGSGTVKDLFNVKSNFIDINALKPSIVNFCISLTFSAIITFIALYALQYEIDNIGYFFTVFALTLLIIRPMSGKLVDRKGYRVVILPGLIFLGVAIILIVIAESLILFLLAAVFYGIGYGSMHPSLQAMVVSRSTKKNRGTANSTLLLSTDVGFGLGAILWGIVANVTGYQTMFVLLLIPIGAALFIHFFYQSSHKTKAPTSKERLNL
ncbi:MFS transporter [Evansella sp. AB-P1]|uniref:MFS transporter n=1 Tax=Evansella sp. AB-P1 TaxID=3037653 RepID=UPI00241EACB9|nr:MFS transporter [Evansella sp. AB-P1]MDG5788854.1 MFS transporter [Evansella sp. AB-P1]